ncbi:mycofactocin-associated electron transfer flavoprotein alpha subunit [Pseudofrankia saprophytica]|uniref:mycofactocin-associated electron transfer flavoprotein alpha subunit n=1 Tax=Pseudofrankia saprophytica TaxID=298655 RepID=UPI001E57EB87|nr:mycofactocin-associated electron transfer flavoprotein alpha subunit [Pseudofrankia saprophytica]
MISDMPPTTPGSPAPGSPAETPAPGPMTRPGSRSGSGPTVGGTVAVVVARGGQVPPGGAEAVAEAGGRVLVVGSGAAEAAMTLHHATGGGPAAEVWWADTGPGLRVGALAASLAPLLAGADLVVLPASADGRDLAPRLAAELAVPLLAGAVQVGLAGDGEVRAELARVDGRLLVAATCAVPAVATLLPGARSVYGGSAEPARIPQQTSAGTRGPVEVVLPAAPDGVVDVEVVEVLEPDPATMDLGEARRVLGGGAGLVARDGGLAGVEPAAAFTLLAGVATALGASAGATRVVTDAGWMGYERQIGTTGITLDPELYIAFGVSGASQHTGGLGAPRHLVSVNTDPSCPMTAMADLGLVTDAGELLVELARRLGVHVPAGAPVPAGPPASPAADVPDPRGETTHG